MHRISECRVRGRGTWEPVLSEREQAASGYPDIRRINDRDAADQNDSLVVMLMRGQTRAVNRTNMGQRRLDMGTAQRVAIVTGGSRGIGRQIVQQPFPGIRPHPVPQPSIVE
ncbi:hypothetical protein [Micromonospora sp. NPDC023737]|uniref:hypothetical protein n=1 Tax=unclassified Micromonospora TaxID=2617518 RepID=UPI0033FB1AEB